MSIGTGRTACRSEYDALIVGGGPSGLATAIAARMHGIHRVHIIEHKMPPVDKACGEGLMPKATAALKNLGIDTSPLARHPITGITFRDEKRTLHGQFLKTDTAFGIERTVLYQALHARARALNVGFSFGTRVTGIAPISDIPPFSPLRVQTSEGEFKSRFVIGADGLHSQVRRWLASSTDPHTPTPSPQIQRASSQRKRFGWRYHLRGRPWSSNVEVYWGNGIEAYVTPLSESLIGLAFLSHRRELGNESALRHFPELHRRLASYVMTGKRRGMGTLEQRCKRLVRGRIALVGDASGYVDANTGEGLGSAFTQATYLAKCLRREDLRPYAKYHYALPKTLAPAQRSLRMLSRHPQLRRAIFSSLAKRVPGSTSTIFEHLLRFQHRRSTVL